MRFHALGVPHTITNKDYISCAYTQKVLKFCKMMTELGHEVFHYGHEHSDVVCTEHITVVEHKYFEMTYGDRKQNDFFEFNNRDLPYIMFAENASREIDKRKQPGDFVLAFFGTAHKPVCDNFPDLNIVEPGIGYPFDHYAPYKVWESYAIMHAYYGLHGVSYCVTSPTNVVIPNYFDDEDFDFVTEKKDWVLYLGRVVEQKGIQTVIDATYDAGVQLIVAGQKDDDFVLPEHCTYVGFVNQERRRFYLSNAKALIIASKYVEPFGGVQVEALLSGTPTITPDHGAFVENNHNGLTGYRCRCYNDYVNAIRSIDTIKPETCRAFGEQFLLSPVAKRYESYFQSILDGETR